MYAADYEYTDFQNSSILDRLSIPESYFEALKEVAHYWQSRLPAHPHYLAMGARAAQRVSSTPEEFRLTCERIADGTVNVWGRDAHRFLVDLLSAADSGGITTGHALIERSYTLPRPDFSYNEMLKWVLA
jgi:hypothetical protein